LHWKNTVLSKYRGLRRALGALLAGVGALLMWLAPESWSGVALLAAGVALEAVGITLEHRNGRGREDSHAVER